MYAISIASKPDHLYVVAARKEVAILSEDGWIPPEYEGLNKVFSETRA